MNEPWRELKVGDRVRIVRFPSAWSRPRYKVAARTKRAYKLLIGRSKRGRSLRVCQVDEWGEPWVVFHIRLPSGRIEYNYLNLVDDDSWVKVCPRNKKIE